MSGIGQDIYKQMMPVVANAMVGGFFKQMAEQFQAAGNAISAGKAPNFFEQWMQAAGMAEKPKAPPPSMFDNPFTQSFQAMFIPPAAGAGANAANPFAGNPFMKAFETMMKPPAASEPEKKADKPAAAPEAATIANLFSQMFDSGIEVQKNYQKSMDGIFDRYMTSLKTDKPGSGSN